MHLDGLTLSGFSLLSLTTNLRKLEFYGFLDGSGPMLASLTSIVELRLGGDYSDKVGTRVCE